MIIVNYVDQSSDLARGSGAHGRRYVPIARAEIQAGGTAPKIRCCRLVVLHDTVLQSPEGDFRTSMAPLVSGSAIQSLGHLQV